MKTRREIVANWLPRYTGVPVDKFGEYILLTNSRITSTSLAEWHGVQVMGKDRPMPNATAATSRSSTSAWAAPPPQRSWTC